MNMQLIEKQIMHSAYPKTVVHTIIIKLYTTQQKKNGCVPYVTIQEINTIENK